MLGCGRKLAAFAAAVSLLVGSGATVAAQPIRAPAPVADVTAQASDANPWLTLSAMTASSANASAAAAEPDESVPVSWPHVVPLSVVLGTIGTAIYILLDDGNDRGLRPTPISPA